MALAQPAPTFFRAVYPVERGKGGEKTTNGWPWGMTHIPRERPSSLARSAQGRKWRNNSSLGLVYGRAALSIRGKLRSKEVDPRSVGR